MQRSEVCTIVYGVQMDSRRAPEQVVHCNLQLWSSSSTGCLILISGTCLTAAHLACTRGASPAEQQMSEAYVVLHSHL